MNIVGVKLGNNSKIYYFDAAGVNVHENSTVIVETEKGLQYGIVTKFIPEEDIDKRIEYKKVIRNTTKEDYKRHLNNLKDADKAIIKCNSLITEYGLDMRIIDASYTFDREQLIFRFVADDRIDFRQLAKDLGSIYKTRIELRQIGIRDKAKDVGGFGPCGRKLCCSNFLNEFDSVSINMAKNQNLSLNPTKINGVCGRLLCCLKYENDNYNEYKKGLPDVGSKVNIDGKSGKVVSVDVFKKKYTVAFLDGEFLTVDSQDDSKK